MCLWRNRGERLLRPARPWRRRRHDELRHGRGLALCCRADGACARVVYRNGGEVNAVALEELCIKVRAPAVR